MTKYEARQIPELRIHPDELTEDVFYWAMAQDGKIAKEHAEKAVRRMQTYTDEVPVETLETACQMIRNVEKYGVACAEWV